MPTVQAKPLGLEKSGPALNKHYLKESSIVSPSPNDHTASDGTNFDGRESPTAEQSRTGSPNMNLSDLAAMLNQSPPGKNSTTSKSTSKRRATNILSAMASTLLLTLLALLVVAEAKLISIFGEWIGLFSK